MNNPPTPPSLREQLEKLYNESRQMGMLRVGSPIEHMVEGAIDIFQQTVAVAKPKKMTLATGLLWDSQDATDGYHEAISEFEQNLLAAIGKADKK